MTALRCEDARRIAKDALAAHGVADRVVDDVLMVVTELVSNAIRHGGGVTRFDVRFAEGDETVIVEVADASPQPPHTPGTPAHVPGGFGWMLVNRLAERTEIELGRAGKVIRACLAGAAGASGVTGGVSGAGSAG
ncbi:ATP-binding protein [Streptomyces avidinii]